LPKLIIFNKPFQVMSQFTDQSQRKTLADFIDIPAVYPAGRLDYDSEGLMLLTDNGALQAKISHPKNKLKKTYWVQVEGIAISEGRNRQVRRMTAAVKLPTLRLVRSAIGEWSLGDLQPGQYRITG
jgi:23S rRNA pseudouridine2457 synthase